MGPPSYWMHVRQTVGRAWRETGQALDRTALRLAAIAQTKYDFGDEPTVCQDFLSRHRQLFPLLGSGRPVVHPQVAYVAPCATLIGSVTVGKGASIWYGAVLRADTTAHAESFHKTDEELLAETQRPVFIPSNALSQEEEGEETVTEIQAKDEEGSTPATTTSSGTTSSLTISEEPFPLPDPERTPYSGGGIVIGEDTNIQDGCILSARTGHCRIGQGVTVGHLAQIHSATVGDFSLIGMGSIIQEGAVVHEEAFVAAGAVVKPGVVVQSGELWVGNPARKLRDLSEKERARLHFQSSEYVQVAKGQTNVMLLGGNLFEDLPQEDEVVEEEKIAATGS